MSFFSNVRGQDLIILRRLAEQQKEQRALKIKKKSLKLLNYRSLILHLFYTNTDTRFSLSNFLFLEGEYTFDVTLSECFLYRQEMGI